MPHRKIQPLSPLEYEILYALVSLKLKGKPKAILPEIRNEINSRRRKLKKPTLVSQIVYYHLQKLSKRPFVKKQNASRNTTYQLKEGTWRLKTTPPLCIYINSHSILVLPCVHAHYCKLKPFSDECLKLIRTVNLSATA